jgi:hypothetical protein
MNKSAEWHRANMRKAFIKAQAELKGVDSWDEADDQFMDLIDNRISMIKSRNGKPFPKFDDADIMKTVKDAIEKPVTQ